MLRVIARCADRSHSRKTICTPHGHGHAWCACLQVATHGLENEQACSSLIVLLSTDTETHHTHTGLLVST